MLFSKRFRERLRFERKARNITQQDLATKLGVSVSTVKRWESGKEIPYSYHRQKLCSFLNVPISLLDTSQSASSSARQRPKERQTKMPQETDPLDFSSYFISHEEQDENLRLLAQDQLITAAMGGPLTEQPDPTHFTRILDVGCGTGGWMIETALKYPWMFVVGLDISHQFLLTTYEQARAALVDVRMSLRVTDVLLGLDVPDGSFDLVNLRFGVSFVRFWQWGTLLRNMRAALRPGGIIRLTDSHDITSSSQALTTLWQIGKRAAHAAGYAMDENVADTTPARLAQMLPTLGFEQIQRVTYTPIYQAHTPERRFFEEDMTRLFRHALPFYRKMGMVPEHYEDLYHTMLDDFTSPTFEVSWPLSTVWGQRSADPL